MNKYDLLVIDSRLRSTQKDAGLTREQRRNINELIARHQRDPVSGVLTLPQNVPNMRKGWEPSPAKGTPPQPSSFERFEAVFKGLGSSLGARGLPPASMKPLGEGLLGGAGIALLLITILIFGLPLIIFALAWRGILKLKELVR